jgi:uncharacterized repeat protein (TIGR01451 family)
VTETPIRIHPRPVLLALAFLALVATLALGASSARAAGGSASISIARTNGLPQNSGAPTQYTINFSCSGVESASCGEHPTIRIPLELTSGLAETPPMSGWAYAASSGVAGLIKKASVVGGAYVIELDPEKLVSGESDTVQLNVTPPNGLTPNGTTWSLAPTFETDEIPAIAVPTPADGEAAAKAQLAVSKKTLDEGAVYVRGFEVTFNITAQCSPGATTGKLFLTEGALVDQLPAGLEYLSATPAPTSAPAVGGSGEIRWDYADAEALPSGCGQGSKGATAYRVVARVPATGTDHEKVENTAIFGGTPIDQGSIQTEAKLPLTLIDEAPEPGELGTNFLNKTSQAPLCIAGLPNCFAGTYPGNWIRPINPSPARTPGASEGSFEVTINYPASRAYETALIDPMPCLEEETSAGEFSSPPVAPPVTAGTIPTCAEPAFNPTAVWVSAPSLAAAVSAGWRPQAILTDGSAIPIPLGANAGTSAYFDLPAGVLGEVVAVALPPDPNLTDNHLSMVVFGYADGGLAGGDALRDVAVASAYPIGSATAAGTSSDEAKIFIEPNSVQPGIRKTFGGLSNGPGGKTQLTTMSLVGSLAVPTGKALSGNVVLADLLPEGMTWSNPAASGTFTVVHGLSVSKAVTATVSRVPDYEESGRELIRVTLPKAAFEEEGGGYMTIKAPSEFFRMQVPNETQAFANDAQIFVLGVGRDTLPLCGSGEGTIPSTFESKDERDLAGDGEEEKNYCQSRAELKVNATGGPNFSLKKFVQGNLDSQQKGALGIGKASRGGTGVFTLVWANNGSAPLAHPVIYDILPHVGDTGVDQGQSGNPRGSEFATGFVEVIGAGALPPGVSVEYSTSTNPCRPEVNPAASGCVEDWSASVPADPSTVKSLRFASTGTYAPGAGFTVEFGVDLPRADVNDVAWNSAASDAETTAGVKLAPAEPPKVGITAPAALVTPTIGTAASEARVLPGRQVHDSITVGGTEERAGTVAWKLLGPVAAGAGESCTGRNWSGAAVAAEGTIAIEDDGTVETPATALTAHGCYAYEATVAGSGFETVTSPAGTAGELVLVHPAKPTLETKVSADSVLPQTAITDSVAIIGTEEFAGTVTWTLFGPLAPDEGGCEGLDWSGAPTFDEGEFAIAADGTGTTAPSTPSAHGCYGYEVTIEGTDLETFNSPAGTAGELVLVHPATPTLATAVTAGSVLPGSTVADSIVVAGTDDFDGTVTWRLAGPVPPVGGSCEAADWSGAATVDEGEIEVEEDATSATDPSVLTEHGCYGYEASIEGEHLTTFVSPLGSAGETVLVHPAKPTLTTSASPADGTTPVQAGDLITIGGTEGFAGTVHWKLAGPVPAAADGSCAGLDWSGAAVVTTGEFAIKGDGATPTPKSDLSAIGCYGYQVSVEGPDLETVASPLGSGGETVLVRAVPPVVQPPQGATADLKLVKRVEESTVEVGMPLHYTIEVTNKGKAPARSTVVTDHPRSPLAFVSAKPSRGKCGDAFPLVCKLGTLAPGAKVTVAVVATPTAAGKLVNSATVSSPDDPDAGSVKAAAATHSLVPLQLRKTVSTPVVKAGGKLRYEIAVINPTVATAHAVKVCDRLPAGLVYLASNPPAQLDAGSYCWRIATLRGHATAKIRIVARALAGAAGRLVNVAVLSGPDSPPRRATAAVRVKSAPVREGGVTG